MSARNSADVLSNLLLTCSTYYGGFIMDLLDHAQNNKGVDPEISVVQSIVQENNRWVAGPSGKAYLVCDNRLHIRAWEHLSRSVSANSRRIIQTDQLD